MIVYTWKQRGNDFNNGDEALFQDANRPRDNDKFKIRPWLQSDKWDWRWSNKNISMQMAQLVVKWWNIVPWSSAWSPIIWEIPKLKLEWRNGEYESIGYPWDDSQILSILSSERYNDPWCVLREWKMQYLTSEALAEVEWQWIEVIKPWLYIIQAYWQYFFPSGFNTNTSYQHKERIGVAQEIEWYFRPINYSVFRACGNGDSQMAWQIWWFEKWAKITQISAHSYTTGNTFVGASVSMVRLQ